MDLARLKDLSVRYYADKQCKNQKLPGLSVLSREAQSDIEAWIYEPVLCLVLQGSKVTSIGDQAVELGPGDALLVSHDLPVVSRITKASAREPYLAVILSLDLRLVRSLYDEVAESPAPDACVRSLSAAPADSAWLGQPFRRKGSWVLDLARNPLPPSARFNRKDVAESSGRRQPRESGRKGDPTAAVRVSVSAQDPGLGEIRGNERVVLSPTLQGGHGHDAATVSKGPSPDRGESLVDGKNGFRCRIRRRL
jgi:hypothetical protein